VANSHLSSASQPTLAHRGSDGLPLGSAVSANSRGRLRQTRRKRGAIRSVLTTLTSQQWGSIPAAIRRTRRAQAWRDGATRRWSVNGWKPPARPERCPTVTPSGRASWFRAARGSVVATVTRRGARARTTRRATARCSNAAESLAGTDDRGCVWRGAGLRCRTDKDPVSRNGWDFRGRSCDLGWTVRCEGTRVLMGRGSAMGTCEAREFGVALGARRKTASPGKARSFRLGSGNRSSRSESNCMSGRWDGSKGSRHAAKREPVRALTGPKARSRDRNA